jgi:hypothetical protein
MNVKNTVKLFFAYIQMKNVVCISYYFILTLKGKFTNIRYSDIIFIGQMTVKN